MGDHDAPHRVTDLVALRFSTIDDGEIRLEPSRLELLTALSANALRRLASRRRRASAGGRCSVGWEGL